MIGSTSLSRLNFPQSVMLDEDLNIGNRLELFETAMVNYEELYRQMRALASEIDTKTAEGKYQMRKIHMELAAAKLRLLPPPLEISAAAVDAFGGYGKLREFLSRQYVMLDASERKKWLNNLLFIMLPDFREAINRIKKVLEFSPIGHRRSVSIGGASGLGKSTFLASLYACNSPIHNDNTDQSIYPCVLIEAPSNNRTPKALCRRFKASVGEITNSRADEEDLMFDIQDVYFKSQVELALLDEVPNIRSNDVRRKFIEISNLLNFTMIVCAGVKAFDWTEGDLEVIGRWNNVFRFKLYKGKRLTSLLAFVELLLPFAEPSHLSIVEAIDENGSTVPGTAAHIEKWTGGVLREIMNLIIHASIMAIERGDERLSLPVLETAWGNLQAEDDEGYRLLLEEDKL